ncbi:MAG: ABC transporter permease [Patescibacteria group bacterium]
MNFAEYVKLAFNALRTNKVRSLLTMLGIIIGVASVILLVSIGTGLQNYVTEQFASLGSNTIMVMAGDVDITQGPRGAMMSASKFELSDVSDLENGSESIKQVSPMVQGFGSFSYKGNTVSTEVWGLWENYFDLAKYEPEYGRIITQNDVERSRRVIVLGNKPAKDLFGEGTNPVGKTLTLNDSQFEIVGVIKSKGGGGAMGSADDFAAIPLTTAMRQFDRDRPFMMFVESIDSDHVTQAKDDAQRILLRRLKDDEFTVLESTQLLETITQFLNVITAALGGIAGISLLVGGIGIMNIMLVSVTERTREIGLRKAVGATPKDIMMQFLIESIILSLFGGAIGIGLGALGSFGISQFITTSVTAWSVMLSFGFSAAIGIIFGVAPAIRAARLDPIEALRYE